MKIELKQISVRDLVKGFIDNDEEGVVGYNGKLDIRPPYQRLFIYGEKERNAVIDTVTKDFPLNVMYWAVRDDGFFEVIDGQQRILSICTYVNGDFSLPINGNNLAFHNLQDDQQEQIYNYPLTVYFCSGSDSEKLDWFRTINIAGKDLTQQELRNAVYSGSWVTDAKRYFSKRDGPAYNISSEYLSGKLIRQEYLETAIRWISNNKIEKFMSDHQHEKDASELWKYFKNIISWVEKNFISKNKKLINGVEWGYLYNKYKNKTLDSKKIDSEMKRLLAFDDTITKPKGIYPFILTGDDKYLSIRAFTDVMKQRAYAKQNSKCNHCEKKFEFSQMEADHIKPWHKGGKSIEENCQMLCMKCNRKKTNK